MKNGLRTFRKPATATCDSFITNSTVQLSKLEGDRLGGLSPEEWKKATRFSQVDLGWIILSIGMAIGAGIIFLPVQAGRVGMWCFFASVAVAYPSLYLFQRLFINTLAESKICS